MKKQYIIPNIRVIKISDADIICTSPTLYSTSSDPGSWNLSRSIDDDFDDFDDF